MHNMKQSFRIILLSGLSATLLAPSLAYAAPPNADPPEDFKELVDLIVSLLADIFPIIIILILLAFLWGLARFIFSLGNVEEATEGKTIMVWGVLALFMAVAVWGFVAILMNTFLGG